MRDVIIVGAGPAGLVCGLHLAKAGLSTLVLEADSRISQNLRGSTFHPSSLDMLESAFGAATPLIQQGLIAPSVQYRRHGQGKIAEFDFSDISHLTDIHTAFKQSSISCRRFYLVCCVKNQMRKLNFRLK